MKVLLVVGLSDEHIGRIKAVSDQIEVVVSQSHEEQLAEVVDADVIFGGFNREIFQRAEKLKLVQVTSAGVDGILFPEFVNSDIILASAKGYVGTHLADQTWALLLGLLRGIGRSVRERTWDNRMSIRHEAWELDGRTLGIVGLGGTGIEVARRSIGFGMRVIAVDPENIDKPDFVDEVWKMDRFHDLLEQSDVVAIGAPLTEETRGMFNLEAFRHMKRHAFLINVTRGKIVDGPSLLQALEEGLIGGAGLDVTPEEPLPQDSPLWDMKNVIITPHVAGGSPRRMDRAVELFCENLRRLMAGEPLISVIDKQKGY
ncbi:TPA: D-2-hydroxyacid dehydrogenase [Candidatus Poribacteria bacterium]|nr:D-2-hydroxyacid dehydrogenase [Candidatus Poribacteria bacterium]